MLSYLAQKKMQFALRRPCNTVAKTTDGNSTALKKSLEHNYKLYSKNPEVSTIIIRNSDKRCFLFTLVALEFDARQKLFAPFLLPLQLSDQKSSAESETHADMDGQDLASSPISPLHTDHQKITKKATSSEKISLASDISDRNAIQQSKRKGHLNKRNRAAKDPSSSCEESCNISNGSLSDLVGINSDSSDVVKEACRVTSHARKGPGKKSKRKAKENRKHSSSCGSLHMNADQSTSCPAAFVKKHTFQGTAIKAASFCESREKSNDDLGKNVPYFLSTPTSCISNKDENDELGGATFSPQHSSTDDSICSRLDGEIPDMSNTSGIVETTDIPSNCQADIVMHLVEQSNKPICVPSGNDTVDSLLDRRRNSDNVMERSMCVKEENGNNPLDGGAASDLSGCYISSDNSLCHSDHLLQGMPDNSVSDVLRISSSCGLKIQTDEWSNTGSIDDTGCMGISRSTTEGTPKNLMDAGTASDCTTCFTSLGNSFAGSHHLPSATLSDSTKDVLRTSSSHGSRIQPNDASYTDYNDRIMPWSQECSSSSDNPVILPGKRSRQSNVRKGNAQSTSLSIHGRSGKENTHSVWQKVQKKGRDHANCNPENVVFSDPKDSSSLSMDESEGAQHPGNSHPSLIQSNGEPLKTKAVKPRRMPASSSKHDSDKSLWKVQNDNKASSIRCMRICMNKEGISEREKANQEHRDSSLDKIALAPLLHSDIPLDVDRTGTENNSRVSDAEAGHSFTPCTSDKLYGVDNKADNSSHLHATLPGGRRLADRDETDYQMITETDPLHQKHSRQEPSTGPMLQRWVPVSRKDAGLLKHNSAVSLNPISDEQVATIMNPSGSQEEISGSLGNPVPSPTEHDVDVATELRELTPTGTSMVSLGNYSSTQIQTCHTDIHMIVQAVDDAMEHDVEVATEMRELPSTGTSVVSLGNYSSTQIQTCHTDIQKIVQAVHDAHLAQNQSEDIRLALGGTLAEFEKLLDAASPVLGYTSVPQHCYSCSKLQMDNSLCRHQIPDTLLGSIWKWYEQHGSYGLEVKADDFINSKILGGRHSEFHAYFVPFLSAVQIFDQPSTRLRDTSKDEESHYSEDGLSSSSRNDTEAGTSELLFEYFESEPPQQRQPLFEKVKELTCGDSNLNSRMFGDPLQLECMHLHDVHPSSWYSVAWYPIYRIPDGNFRAAFLTYHSFGHCIPRESPYGGKNIVCPVVGLESYNAQSECWFKPKIPSIVWPHGEASKILEERLKTLEQTASVMARASINKSNQMSVNMHPDYEFFLSRRR